MFCWRCCRTANILLFILWRQVSFLPHSRRILAEAWLCAGSFHFILRKYNLANVPRERSVTPMGLTVPPREPTSSANDNRGWQYPAISCVIQEAQRNRRLFEFSIYQWCTVLCADWRFALVCRVTNSTFAKAPHQVMAGSPNLGTSQRLRPQTQRRWIPKGEWGRWTKIMRFWADKRRLGLRSRLNWVCTAAGAANAWEWDL